MLSGLFQNAPKKQSKVQQIEHIKPQRDASSSIGEISEENLLNYSIVHKSIEHKSG